MDYRQLLITDITRLLLTVGATVPEISAYLSGEPSYKFNQILLAAHYTDYEIQLARGNPVVVDTKIPPLESTETEKTMPPTSKPLEHVQEAPRPLPDDLGSTTPKQQARTLHSQGLNFKEIGLRLNISPQLARYYIKLSK